MTKTGSLILSEKPSAAPEPSLLLFSQRGTRSAGWRLTRYVPITPGKKKKQLCVKYVHHLLPHKWCVQVCRLCNYPLLTRQSHRGTEGRNVRTEILPLPLKSDVTPCPLNSRLAGAHTHTHRHTYTTKNLLMRLQATAGSSTENKHWQKAHGLMHTNMPAASNPPHGWFHVTKLVRHAHEETGMTLHTHNTTWAHN